MSNWIYSSFERALERAPRQAESGHFMSWLDGAVRRGEIAREEREWLGVDTWLKAQSGRVSRDALADYARQNAITIGEVVLAETSQQARDAITDALERLGYSLEVYNEDEVDQAFIVRDSDGCEVERESLPSDVFALVMKALVVDDKRPRYEKTSSLPGGANYREILLTFPNQPARAKRALSNYTFVQTHWNGVPDVFAHVRIATHDRQHGERVLLVDEFQSDWAQGGRARGYRSETAAKALQAQRDHVESLRARVEATPADSMFVSYNRESLRSAEKALAARSYSEADGAFTAVPDLPFAREWPLLLMKRVLALAVAEGIDRIAWVDSEVQMVRAHHRKEGMSLFYDEVLPRLVGRYLVPWGIEVTRATLEYASDAQPVGVYQFELTPEIKSAISAGQPLFSKVLPREPTRAPVAAQSTDASGKWPIAPIERMLAAERWVNASVSCGEVSEFAAAVEVLSGARAALVAELVQLPEDCFALAGRTSAGRLHTLTRSAKDASTTWQITQFDGDGAPWSDRQYDSKQRAVDEFLIDCTLGEVHVAGEQFVVAGELPPAPGL